MYIIYFLIIVSDNINALRMEAWDELDRRQELEDNKKKQMIVIS